MERQSRVYKNAQNRILDTVRRTGVGNELPPETALAEQLGVSRTTVRAVLKRLDEVGILSWDKRRKQILRLPAYDEYYAPEEAIPTQDKIEAAFISYVAELPPDTVLSESQLAAQFGVATSAVREFLIRFSRFGLITKEPNRRWVLKGVTREFADDLFNIRELFETRALALTLEAWDAPEVQRDFTRLAADHRKLKTEIAQRHRDFRRLDERLHRRLLEALGSRLVGEFIELLSIVCFNQYMWRGSDQIERATVAIDEHLTIIDAILAGDKARAKDAMVQHLRTARDSLLRSTGA